MLQQQLSAAAAQLGCRESLPGMHALKPVSSTYASAWLPPGRATHPLLPCRNHASNQQRREADAPQAGHVDVLQPNAGRPQRLVAMHEGGDPPLQA